MLGKSSKVAFGTLVRNREKGVGDCFQVGRFVSSLGINAGRGGRGWKWEAGWLGLPKAGI